MNRYSIGVTIPMSSFSDVQQRISDKLYNGSNFSWSSDSNLYMQMRRAGGSRPGADKIDYYSLMFLQRRPEFGIRDFERCMTYNAHSYLDSLAFKIAVKLSDVGDDFGEAIHVALKYYINKFGSPEDDITDAQLRYLGYLKSSDRRTSDEIYALANVLVMGKYSTFTLQDFRTQCRLVGRDFTCSNNFKIAANIYNFSLPETEAEFAVTLRAMHRRYVAACGYSLSIYDDPKKSEILKDLLSYIGSRARTVNLDKLNWSDMMRYFISCLLFERRDFLMSEIEVEYVYDAQGFDYSTSGICKMIQMLNK